MTDQRELDRLLGAYFIEGTDELADRVIDAALDHIDHIPQRRAVRVPRRFQTMTMPTRVAAAAVIGVLAVGGAFYLTRPDQPAVGGPSPTPGVSSSPSQPASPLPDLSAGTPGPVTGQLLYDAGTSGNFQESVDVDGGARERVRVRTATSEMSDARLSGTVTVTDNADRFFEDTDTYLGDVLWGTIVIENDEGTWTGPLTGTSDPSADGRGVTYIELVGAGAYEGLSAILFEREEGAEPDLEWDWNGIIFAGNLPPDR